MASNAASLGQKPLLAQAAFRSAQASYAFQLFGSQLTDSIWATFENVLTNQYSFVHIEAVQDELAPLLAISLTRSPVTPFAGQPTQTTFRVCNYGASPFDASQVYVKVSAPGTDFPAVDPPALVPGSPGGCYDYDQTLAAFPNVGWYTIRAGYLDGGTFKEFDVAAGQINGQTLYVASTDLRGDL